MNNNIHWKIRSEIWHNRYWQWLYPQILKIFRPRLSKLLVSSATDVVIEGFPRSANTFLVHAFRLATKEKFVIAHHLHDPCQIVRAMKYEIPCFIVIRNPLDVAASWILKDPSLDAETILYAYVSYYDFARRFDKVRFCDYGIVVENTELVINCIAKDVGYDVHELIIPSSEDVFAIIDAIKRNREGWNERGELTVARPSDHKKELRAKIVSRIVHHNERQLSQAMLVYEHIRPKCIA